MTETITLKESSTLGHQSNLGEDVEEIAFEAGEEFTVLKEWENSYLAKNADGKLFNIRKALVE
jgi:hypothetical protein